MSWYQLLDIITAARQEAAAAASRPPVACPNDGQPLVSSPPGSSSQLFCPFDGFTYPRDWDARTMSGM